MYFAEHYIVIYLYFNNKTLKFKYSYLFSITQKYIKAKYNNNDKVPSVTRNVFDLLYNMYFILLFFYLLLTIIPLETLLRSSTSKMVLTNFV